MLNDTEITDNLLERFLIEHRSEALQLEAEDLFNRFSCSYIHTPYNMELVIDIIRQIRTFRTYADTLG